MSSKSKPVPKGGTVVTERRLASLLSRWAQSADAAMAQKIASEVTAAEARIRMQLRKEFNLPEPSVREGVMYDAAEGDSVSVTGTPGPFVSPTEGG